MHIENRLSHNWLALKINNDKMLEFAKVMKGTVIDLGAGTCPYKSEISQYADQYWAIDWTNTMHSFKADIAADLTKHLPVKSDSIDAILSLEVLEHLANPQMALSEAYRILRHGGKIYLSVPFQWREHEQPWDFFRFTRYGLNHILKQAGFCKIEINAKHGFWVMLALKLNYHSLSLIRGPKILRLIIRLCLIPIWWSNQTISPIFDKVWPGKDETIGYFAVAEKP